jgi:hypothetical protein
VPRPLAIERRKWRQVPHDVVDLWQTQQRAASACGVAQWGHRHTAMVRIVAAPEASVESLRELVERACDMKPG